MMMTYEEMVAADVRDYIGTNANIRWDYDEDEVVVDYNGDTLSVDDFQERLDSDLYNNDSVTGGASGSYTCNRWTAQEYVLDDIETLQEAAEAGCISAEDIGSSILNGDWEALDVICRCYVLWRAAGQAIEEELEIAADAGKIPA